MMQKSLKETKALAFASTAIVMAFSGQVWAQDGQSPPTAASGEGTVLQEVVVTGSRKPQQVSQTAHTIRVVEGDVIARQARMGLSLQEILGEEIPSFDPGSQGARTSYSQNLRGRTALVLIDGVSMNSARGLSRQFDSIDPFNIARVEVLSGATSIHGGNATGGVINIITKKGSDAEDGLHGEVQGGVASGFAGSSDFDRNAAGAVTYKTENFDARLSVSGTRNGAFYDGSGTMVIPDITQTSMAFNERIDIMGSVGIQIDDTRRLEIGTQYFDSQQQSDYGLYYGVNFAALFDPSQFETRDGYSSDVDPRTTRRMINLTYTDDDFLEQELLLQAAYRSEAITFNPFPGTSPSLYFGASQQDTDYFAVKAAMIAEPLDGLSVTYGIDADHDSFSATQSIFDLATAAATGGMTFDVIGETGLYPDIDVSTVAGFAQVSYEATDRLTLSGGTRYQFVQTEVSDFIGAAQQIAILNGTATGADAIPGGEVDYAAFLFNAGASYELDDASQIYGNFSQGFDLPDPGKYYGVGNYSLAGGYYSLLSSVNVEDSPLQEIKTDSFELGYRLDNGTYNFDIAGFYSRSDKSITLNRTAMTISLTDAPRQVYGVEASAGVKFDNGFDIGANGQWIRSEVKDGGDWVNETVGTASVSSLGGHVGWTNDAWRLKFAGQHVFSLEDNDGHEIEGYTLFNFGGSYTFADQATTVNFGIQNVFDTQYTTIWGSRAKALYGALADEAVFDYQGRGRTLALSITKTF
jgi:iron complex outermembrane receptor protein